MSLEQIDVEDFIIGRALTPLGVRVIVTNYLKLLRVPEYRN